MITIILIVTMLLIVYIPQSHKYMYTIKIVVYRAADARKKMKSYAHTQNDLKFPQTIFESTDKMHPPLQDFLTAVMDIMTMTMHINPQYKHITILYWSVRLSCCLQKSIAKSLSRKCSASNGLAAKGLHFSHPHRELSIERDLTLLSIGVAVCV